MTLHGFAAGPGNEPNHAFERLVAFLYLTMRNDLPTGKVCDTVNAVTENTEVDFKFSNPHLEALARDYANRISEG